MLRGVEKRAFKARAQMLKATLRLGRAGATEAFLASLDKHLATDGLVKVRFADFKEEKKTLAPELASKTGSELIMRVGNVAVYYRAKQKSEIVTSL